MNNKKTKKDINKNDDDKKRYQINISLTAYEYSLIKTLAMYERRTAADIARLILIDNAQQLINKYNNFEIAYFIPLKKDN